MIGLIYKDIKAVFNQIKIIILLLALYMGYCFYLKDLQFFTGMEPGLSLVLSLLAFGYDEKTHWDKIACSFPMGRKSIVASRYIFSVIIICILSILHVLVALGLKAEAPVIWDTLALVIGCGLLLTAILFPFIYRFGTEKTRLIFFVFFFAALTLINSGLKSDSKILQLGNIGNLGIVGIGVVLFLASFFISSAIYQKKEF